MNTVMIDLQADDEADSKVVGKFDKVRAMFFSFIHNQEA